MADKLDDLISEIKAEKKQAGDDADELASRVEVIREQMAKQNSALLGEIGAFGETIEDMSDDIRESVTEVRAEIVEWRESIEKEKEDKKAFAKSREFYEQGISAFKGKDFSKALECFIIAYDRARGVTSPVFEENGLTAAFNASFLMANCLEKLDKITEALDIYYQLYAESGEDSDYHILKELGLLRRMFNVARKQWKWKIVNPVSEIELPKVRNERVRYLEPHEYRNLLAVTEKAPETWLNPLVIVAIDTGLRLTNLCNLLWTEVNLFSRMITIDAEKMKNDDYIGIPLTDRAYQTLKELQRVQCVSGHVFHDAGQPLYDRKVQRAFRKALDAAEIGNFHFHDLRHTFASYLRQQGVDLHTIAVLMGHKDLRMTKRYAHLNVDSLKDAVAKLNFTIFSRIDKQEGKKVAVPTGFEPVF